MMQCSRVVRLDKSCIQTAEHAEKGLCGDLQPGVCCRGVLSAFLGSFLILRYISYGRWYG